MIVFKQKKFKKEKFRSMASKQGVASSAASTMEAMPSISEMEALTKDVIEDYTEREIEGLIKLQHRFDSFHYTPVDSQGGLLPDDGTDPLYYYQSNLVPILNLIQSKFKQDLDEDDKEEADGLCISQLRRDQQHDLDKLRVASSNNCQVNEERSRAKLLAHLASEAELNAGSSRPPNIILDLLGENKSLIQVDDNVVVDGLGTPEQQMPMFQRMLKHRRDQSNSVKRIVGALEQKLEQQIKFSSSHSVAAAEEAAVQAKSAQDSLIFNLNKQIVDLKREQEYLYWRLYGPSVPGKADTKMDRQKKYRKEVDDAYKQMIDAEVAKRVVKAVKQSDAFVKKVRDDLDATRRMMTKCHNRMLSVIFPARLSLRVNRRLESHRLADEDTFQFTQRAEEALTAVSEEQDRLEQQADGGGGRAPPPLSVATFVDTNGLLPDQQLLVESTVELERALRVAIDSASNKLAEVMCNKQVPADVSRALCSAVSEGGTMLRSTFKISLETASSAIRLFPSSLRADAGAAMMSNILTRCIDSANQVLPQFVHSIIEGRDSNYVNMNLQRIFKVSNLKPLSKTGTDQEVQTEDSYEGALTARRLRRQSVNSDWDSRSHATDDHMETQSTVFGDDEDYYYEEVEESEDEDGMESVASTALSQASGAPRRKSLKQSNLQLDVTSPKEDQSSSTPRRKKKKVMVKKLVKGTKPPAASSRRTQDSSRTPSRSRSISESSKLTPSHSRRDLSTHPPSKDRKEKKAPVVDIDVPVPDTTPTVPPPSEKAEKKAISTHQSPVRKAPPKLLPAEPSPKESRRTSDPPVETAVVAKPVAKPKDRKPKREVVTFQKELLAAENDTPATASSSLAPTPAESAISTETSPSVEYASRKVQTMPPPKKVSISTQVFEQQLRSSIPKKESVKETPPVTPTETAVDSSSAPTEPIKHPFPTGRCTFAFVGIDAALVYWQRCPDVMPNILKAYLQILRDGLEKFSGYEARVQGDAMMCAFATEVQAASWALWVQHHLLKLPYPRSILSISQGAEVVAGDGQCVWRGFRVRIGIHAGETTCTIKANRPRYTGSVVTFASRMAMFACGGQIVISNAVHHALQESLESMVGVSLRSQGDCKGEYGAEPIFDVVDGLLSLRHLNYDMNDAAAHAGTLYQWQCTYAAQHDFDIHERLAFVFLDVQSEVDFIDQDSETINAATQLVMGEARKLATKYHGKEVRSRGPSSLFVFSVPLRAAQFANAAQLRALKLPYSQAVMQIPECTPISESEDGIAIWAGLKLRVGLHYGRPSSTSVNRTTNQVEYFGQEVNRGAFMAASSKFGETLLSSEFYAEVKEDLSRMESEPVVTRAGERHFGVDSVGAAFTMYPKALAARAFAGDSATFFRQVFDFSKRDSSHSLGSKKNSMAGPASPSRLSFSGTESTMVLPAEEFEVGDESYICVCTLENVAELIDSAPEDLEVGMNCALRLMKDLLVEFEGYQSSVDGVTTVNLFNTASQAAQFAVKYQRELLKLEFPDKVFDMCETIEGETKGEFLFRGLRFGSALHCGVLHEYYTGVLTDRKKAFYGTAVNHSTHLSTSFVCGGEIVMTDAFQRNLVEDEVGQRFLAAGSVFTYRLESILLPGDLQRTPLFGMVAEEHTARRKRFFRAGKQAAAPAADAISGEVLATTSPGSPSLSASNVLSPGAMKMRNTKFLFDLHGWHISQNQSDLGSLGTYTKTNENESMHIVNGNQLQRLYRLIWQVADKCGRVMGYPPDIDEDPYAFDAALRDALAADYDDDNATLLNCSNVVLTRLHEMVREMMTALGCRTEKGVFKHHTQQSVIFIPPDAKKDDALYKKHDLGAGKRVTVGTSSGGPPAGPGGDASFTGAPSQQALVGSAGYRTGVSSSLVASRLQEKRIIALEKEVEDLKERAQPIAGLPDGTSDTRALIEASTLLVSQNQQLQSCDDTMISIPEVSKTTGVLMDKRRGLRTRTQSKKLPVCPPQSPLAPTALLWKKSLPLAPLQTPYEPDPEMRHLQMLGETTSTASLSAPFSTKMKRASTSQSHYTRSTMLSREGGERPGTVTEKNVRRGRPKPPRSGGGSRLVDDFAGAQVLGPDGADDVFEGTQPPQRPSSSIDFVD